jgi:hypothetical protein
MELDEAINISTVILKSFLLHGTSTSKGIPINKSLTLQATTKDVIVPRSTLDW